MLSQTTSTPEQRVKTVINAKGDTLIEMSISDAKIVFDDVLEKRVSDSLISVLSVRDSIFSTTIILQVAEMKLIQQKYSNETLMVTDLNLVLSNKDKEIADLNDVVKKQKKEIRKQKILKIIGFTGSVALPIATFLLLTL